MWKSYFYYNEHILPHLCQPKKNEKYSKFFKYFHFGRIEIGKKERFWWESLMVTIMLVVYFLFIVPTQYTIMWCDTDKTFFAFVENFQHLVGTMYNTRYLSGVGMEKTRGCMGFQNSGESLNHLGKIRTIYNSRNQCCGSGWFFHRIRIQRFRKLRILIPEPDPDL